MKICFCCKKSKPRNAFSRNSNTKDGLFCICKICVKQKYGFKTKVDKNVDRNFNYRENFFVWDQESVLL